MLMAAMVAWAAPVSENQAKQIAAQFAAQQIAAARGSQTVVPQLAMKQAEGAFYVYNVGSRDGFVVVSGDDRTPAILGYATSGSFDEQTIPDNMRAWLQGYADQIEYANAHPGALAPIQRAAREPIAPLVTSTWGQGAPYNNMCPVDPETEAQCVTGCAATAMAQVVNYHKSPAKTIATIPAYTTDSRGINVPAMAPTTIDWANMLDDYSGSSTTKQKNAVATLMKLCGASINMNYTSNVSGAMGTAVAPALVKYFAFDNRIFYADRAQFTTLSWESMIYGELAAKRPVFYDGQSAGGGHAFVVDGYDGNGLFHVNWGWNGSSDNYFLLSILNPYSTEGIGASTTDDGYSFVQHAIINAQPVAATSTLATASLSTYAMSVSGSKTLTRQADGNFVAGAVLTILNVTGSTRTFYGGLGVFDGNDNLMGGTCYVYDEVSDDSGWQNLLVSNFAFGAGYPDGVYKIKAVSSDGSLDMMIPNAYSNIFYIQAVISGNTCTLTEPVVDLSGTITVDGPTMTDSPINLKINVQNQGTDFSDEVYLLVDGSLAGGQFFEIAAGQTTEFEMEFKVEEPGTKTVQIICYDGEGSMIIAEKQITVVPSNHQLVWSISLLNGDEQNVVKENKVRFNVTVKNVGESNFGNLMATVIRQMNAEDKFELWKYEATKQSVKAGETLTFEAEFDALETGKTYSLEVQYMLNGEMTPGENPNYVNFTTEFSGTNPDPEPEPDPDADAELSIVINIDNLDESSSFAELHTSTVSGSVVVTNTGTVDYNNTVEVDLFRYNSSTEKWAYLKGNVYEDQTIKKNAQKTYNFSFDNLNNGEIYGVAVFYKKNETDEEYELVYFYTNIVAEDEPMLTATFSFPDVTNGILTNNTLTGSAVITNSGTTSYSNYTAFELYEWSKGDEWNAVDESIQYNVVTLAVGASTTKNFEYTNLQNGKTYCVLMWYAKDAENWDYVVSPSFTINLTTGVERMGAADVEVNVYTVDGRLVAKLPQSKVAQLLRKQPKGIYIVGGKKLKN